MTESIVAHDEHMGHWYTGEEIVRCRDCKEFAFGDVEFATADWCNYWDTFVESPDGFCAWGEVRAGSSKVRVEGNDVTATERLRELLDERGVDWRKWSGNSKRQTKWFMPNSNIGSDEPGGYFATVDEHKNGTLHFKSMIASPEQAITATLGAGTCHTVEDGGLLHCSECGGGAEKQSWAYWNYCPNCGAKVVDE